MKKTIFISALLLAAFFSASAQKYGTTPREQFGPTINLGAGGGSVGYYGHSMPILTVNVEFDIARNVTLAPFVGLSGYSDRYYYGSYTEPYRYYTYRETIIPIGIKGAYYFDELFHAGPKWDFYAAASMEFVSHSVTWENGYNGDRTVVAQPSPIFGAAHIGARLHCTQRFGLYLDLATDYSTFGMSFKL